MRISLRFFLFILISCTQNSKQRATPGIIPAPESKPTEYKFIKDIETPESYTRIQVKKGSFGEWLRDVPLKKDKRVFLYNGSLKPNQAAQFAVIDIPVGNKDLQQCADAVMRLRAEYLYANNMQMAFMDYSGKWYKWNGSGNRKAFENYLQTVFGWCGSASLEKQLTKVENFHELSAGDVLVQGGFPGHAMIVADVAINEAGEKLYLLVQGYQPAQDIHVLINPVSKIFSPWYSVESSDTILTPEWRFEKKNLKTW